MSTYGQASPLPRCKGSTPVTWFRSTPQPCKLAAWKDGWCKAHHPLQRALRETPLRELRSAQANLEKAKKRVKFYEDRITKLEGEVRKAKQLIEQHT